MKIADIMEQIEQRANDAQEPADLCWIVTGDTDWHMDYCPECAKKIVAWLRDGGKQPDFAEHEEYPTFADVKSESNYHVRDSGHEAEGCCHCEHCGHHLDVVLLEYGIDSELDHFENVGITTPSEWRYFQDVCEGIEYVESDWFPGDWMKEGEVEMSRDLHTRTIALAKKYLMQVEVRQP